MRPLVIALSFVMGLALGACGSDSGDKDVAPQCARDPALIAARDACRSDALCPCGSHCELGQCTASCSSASDCEGDDYCDDFGRCRDVGSTDRIAPLGADAEARSQMGVSPSVIYVSDSDTAYFVTLRPTNGKPGPARAVAHGGVELVCSEGADATRECAFAEVPVAGLEISVRYRSQRDARDSDEAIVEIYDAAGHARSIMGVPLSNAAIPLEGSYLGLAWLERVGAGEGEVEPIRSQTRVLVFQRAGVTTLAISDAIGGVLGEPLVMTATPGDDGALSATLPARIAYAATTHDGTEAEVMLSAATAGTGRLGNGHVELTFQVAIGGLDLDNAGIPYRLVIAADRSGDLPTGAAVPALTIAATPSQDPLRGRAVTPLFAALEVLANAGDPYANEGDRTAFDATRGVTPIACFASADELVEAYAGAEKAALAVDAGCLQYDAALSYFGSMSDGVLHAIDNRDCTQFIEPEGVGIICAMGGSFEGRDLVYDGCDAMAAANDCVVMASPSKFVFHGYRSSDPDRSIDVYSQKMCWFDKTRYTVFPAQADCLGATACLDADKPLSEVAAFTEFLSERSGEPTCRDAVTFGVFEAADTAEPSDILAECTTDLSRDLSTFTTLSDVFGSAGCIDRGRWRLRLEAAAQALLAQSDVTSMRMVNHLVQQWLQLHALVARLGFNQLNEQLVLATAGDPTADAVAALDASLAGWASVLQPGVAGTILASSHVALRDPDPRPDLDFVVTDAVATARVSVAVDLLETAAEQADLLDLLLKRAWFEGNSTRIDARRATAAELLRVAGLVQGLAEDIHRAANSDGVSTWETAWQRGVARYQGSMSRLSARIELILSGANPIGIEDTDLPLYYRGAPVTPEERFGATSRYLVGEGASSTAIAPDAIDKARVALDAARARWAERRLVRDLDDRRIQDIKFRYGELITGYCGSSIQNDSNYAGPGQPPCLNPGSQSLFDCDQMNTEFCFVEESCRPRPQAFTEELTSADLGYALCVGTGLKKQYGASVIGISNELDAVLNKVGSAFATARDQKAAFPIKITALTTPSPNRRLATITFAGAPLDVPLDALGQLDVRVPEAALRSGLGTSDESPYRRLLSACDVARQKTLAATTNLGKTTCTLADECDRGLACRGGSCQRGGLTDPLDTVDCYYDGAISEQAIAVRGAANDIEIATAEFDEYSRSYDIAVKSCLLQKAGADQQEAELADHNQTMKELDGVRRTLANLEAVAAGGKDCASTVAGSGAGALTGAPAYACGLAAVEAAAKVGGQLVEQRMGEAERQHDAKMQRLQNQTALKVCLNDAELQLVGARAATLRVLRAQQDQAIAMINLRGQKSYTAGLFKEGHQAVAMEEARLERSLPSQFALSEAAELFTSRMAYAQRVTYLAVRAAEYEFQTSLAARQKVLAATRPDELEDALATVSAFVNANRVAGSAPGSLHAVLSLRQHLLQLVDRSDDAAGQQALTDVQRFQALLTGDENRIYDDAGKYLGQLIPFSISPLGKLGRGISQGLPILADNDCAERVWSVNSAVIGEGVFEGNASSFTRLDLLKMNTFYSQWCGNAPADQAFQVASVRPAVNLFFDAADPNRTPVEAIGALPYTRGRMQPYLNVSRSDFEKEDYSQGATTELAGRGLYGDYALFIPAGALSVNGSEGLRPNKIEDILLRLDYVSVAKN